MATHLYPKTSEPQKSLIKILKKHSGRDNSGKVSMRHQGGRQKRYYRIIDFKRDKRDMEATVKGIEYDPNRNAHIALVEYADGEKRYIIHPKGLEINDKIAAGDSVEIKVGNALPLKNIPLSIEVHCVEMYPGKGAQMIRGAGSVGVVIAKEGPYVQIKLPSGEVKKFFADCYATVGAVGNITHKDRDLRKAGTRILMGIRPTVRGTAQNPRSHPHGGGEGRSGEGMHTKTPWGKPARGKKTRNKNKWTTALIVKRKK